MNIIRFFLTIKRKREDIELARETNRIIDLMNSVDIPQVKSINKELSEINLKVILLNSAGLLFYFSIIVIPILVSGFISSAIKQQLLKWKSRFGQLSSIP